MIVTTTATGLGMMATSIAERDWLRSQADATYDDGGLYVVKPADAMTFKARGEAAGHKFEKLSAAGYGDRKVGLELEGV